MKNLVGAICAGIYAGLAFSYPTELGYWLIAVALLNLGAAIAQGAK